MVMKITKQRAVIDFPVIPPLIMNAIYAYVENRHKPGDFLQAILRNDLMETLARADMSNRIALPDIVVFIYNNAPASCWGSPAKVAAWLRRDQP